MPTRRERKSCARPLTKDIRAYCAAWRQTAHYAAHPPSRSALRRTFKPAVARAASEGGSAANAPYKSWKRAHGPQIPADRSLRPRPEPRLSRAGAAADRANSPAPHPPALRRAAGRGRAERSLDRGGALRIGEIGFPAGEHHQIEGPGQAHGDRGALSGDAVRSEEHTSE